MGDDVAIGLLQATAATFAEVSKTAFESSSREPMEHEPYGRSLLAESEHAELLVMCWAADKPCAPHDHGAAEGLIRVLEGRLTETTFALQGGRLVQTHERQVRAGDVLELGADVIHHMRAHGHARTLHLYRPRIRGMRVWDVAGGRVLVVDDTHGAFVPSEARWIVSEDPWQGPTPT